MISALEEQINAGFREVNFIESLITIFYDLTAGFCVLSFNVEPKERLETTVQKDMYGLEAWLCNRTSSETRSYDNAPNRTMPAPIGAGYTNTTNNPNTNPNAKYFNQGALITVCVAPDDLAWVDGIRMDGITEFDWLRNDLNSTGVCDTGIGRKRMNWHSEYASHFFIYCFVLSRKLHSRWYPRISSRNLDVRFPTPNLSTSHQQRESSHQ